MNVHLLDKVKHVDLIQQETLDGLLEIILVNIK